MNDCIFCKIARHEIPGQTVYEDDELMAFRDVRPVAPVHILIIPKRHIPSLFEIEENDSPLMGRIVVLAKRLADEDGIAQQGFRLVVNSGEHAGQSVPHIHFHLLGGRSLGWPPG
jgi:histidine triad (HIT) family protein